MSGAPCRPSAAAVYEIQVAGLLDDCWAVWFPDLLLRRAAGVTTLRGALADQAALHGVLARVRDLGLTLLLVARDDAARLIVDRQDQHLAGLDLVGGN